MTRRRSILAMLASLFGFGAVAKAEPQRRWLGSFSCTVPTCTEDHDELYRKWLARFKGPGTIPQINSEYIDGTNQRFVPGPHGLLYDVLEKGEALAFRVDESNGKLMLIDWYDMKPSDVVVLIGIDAQTGELWMAERMVVGSGPCRDDKCGAITSWPGQTVSLLRSVSPTTLDKE